MTKGIDVSVHNGVIDWDKVRRSSQVDFAVIRAGYGRLISQKDKQFENNYAGCKENDIPCGVYWYSYAHSVAEAQTEARVFLEAIKGKSFEFPVYLDFEEASQFRLGKATCSAMARAFLEIVESAGYFVGIYSSKSGLENYLDADIRRKYSVWVAHVNVAKTSYSMPYDVWQYSWKGKIDGISGDVDCNYCYKNYPTIIKGAGLNGFPKSTPSQNVPPPSDAPENETVPELETKKKIEIIVKLDGKIIHSETVEA